MPPNLASPKLSCMSNHEGSPKLKSGPAGAPKTRAYVKVMRTGPMDCNCVILADLKLRKAIVVDPGGDARAIAQILKDLDVTLELIVHTHAHCDHFLASGELKELTGAPLALHPDDNELWSMLEVQCNLFGLQYKETPPPDIALSEGYELPVFSGKVIHTPGHSPGSVCLHFKPINVALTGDTLFAGSVGRTDLWGGDATKLAASVHDRIFTLADSTHLIPGHGNETTVKHEKANNPLTSTHQCA